MFRALDKSDECHVNHRNPNSVCNPHIFEKATDMDYNKPKRILVVDDDRTIRNLLDTFLSALEFEVKTAGNAYDALNLFINEKFDLVLSDIQMPGMDGWELASNIKKTSLETPVILITGMDKSQVQKQMKNSLADSVLYKPFNLKYIKTTVYDFLGNTGLDTFR